MADQVQQIKDKLNIKDIIGEYVKLTKAGKNYKGLSPFSNEKTPSFFVSPDKGMYYDFSSGQGGDIFSFIQKMEGVDFKGALTMLADRAGVELKRENKQTRDARDRAYKILEEATVFFETKLNENREALKYLEKRGIKENTIKNFRIGFASNNWQELGDYLRKLGYLDREIEYVGLIKHGEKGRYYDRFRSRIMFPIADSVGRIVAFSGRIFGEPAKDEKNAKYINSPETKFFDKSRILYGYDKAKQYIRKYDFSILVEGQMDIVMSHQAGYGNTVAVSGTGLTEDHLSLLKRLSKKLVIAFDADNAGIASTGRASVLALKHGIDVKVAKIPDGKDPADYILENTKKWKDVVRNSKHVVDFYMDVTLKKAKDKNWDERQLILQVRDNVLPYIARITSGTDQAHFVRNISNILSINEESVWQDVKVLSTNNITDETNNNYSIKNKTQAKNKITRKEDLERTLAGFLYWQDTLEPKTLDENTVKKNTIKLQIPLEKILAKYNNEKDNLAFQAEITYKISDDPHEILNNLMTDLAKELLPEKLSHISQKIREAERAKNEDDVKKMMLEHKNISLLKKSLE